jgi:hypothetical protein
VSEARLVGDKSQSACATAAARGFPDSTRLLVAREHDLLRHNKWPPLSTACLAKLAPDRPSAALAECVFLLLFRCYDVLSPLKNVHDLCVNDEQRTVVNAFLRYRDLTAAEAHKLSDAEAKVAFRIAAQCNRVDAVRALAPRCKGHRYYLGRTAITYAICERHVAVVEALLPYEAGLVDDDGWSNLRLACAVSFPEIVKLLASVPTELAALDLKSRSITDYCAHKQCRAILHQALDAHRRSLRTEKARDPQAETAPGLSCGAEVVDWDKLILGSYFAPDTSDMTREQLAARMLAAQQADLQCVRLLLELHSGERDNFGCLAPYLR